GNESTTTKAVLDLFNFLDSEKGEEFRQKITFCIIPMLNPDGAEKWTRSNANDVDLNRDSQNLTQPESRILRKCIENFNPDFCFNLHDQRTIFGVEGTQNPATVSFLAPSYNQAKEINDVRKKAMEVIAYMNETLQKYIPNQVGRYDDAFNINCVGDTVQQMGIPTVLIEAGHYPNDYQREITRKMVFMALVSGLYNFKLKRSFDKKYLEYFNIPCNLIFFFDFLYKNIKFNYDNKQIITNFAVQFSERVEKREIVFEAFVREVGELNGFCGHFEFDAKGEEYSDDEKNFPSKDKKADFFIGNQEFKNGKPVKINRKQTF
ncbi:MAG: M14 family zinc carboxypeptidase, partial [Weeksellaceae bacterium]|nr:M14 family zinc carboxypeptidase [Weeksellaceae bacterium]